MKKIIILSFFLAMSVIGFSQTSAFSQTASNPTGAILNTSVDTMSLTTIRDYESAGVQVVVTKATGTMAGTAILYGSLNGTNYVSTGDTLTLANSTTNTTIWTKTAPVWKYYRILVGGATTVTGTCAATFVGRNP